jgi:DNA-binding transcriptional regulator YiaG
MPNIGKVLKDEIARISRKEVKASIGGLGKSYISLKRIVGDLKKRVASLEKENRRLVAQAKKTKPEPAEKASEKREKARFTSKGIRSLRNRLRLTQADFAKLVGATPHAVYLWEKKEGPLNLRDKTKTALLSIRGLGTTEAKAKLENTAGKRKKRKAVTP